MFTQHFAGRYTDAMAGIAHLVTDEAVAAGRSRRVGRYQALCGRVFAVAPLAAPDGQACALCRRMADESTRQPAEPPGRHRRTSRARRFRRRLLSTATAGL